MINYIYIYDKPKGIYITFNCIHIKRSINKHTQIESFYVKGYLTIPSHKLINLYTVSRFVVLLYRITILFQYSSIFQWVKVKKYQLKFVPKLLLYITILPNRIGK